MSLVAGRSPQLRRARRPDFIALARAKRADEYVSDPKREREAMLRFLTYLKPHIPMFATATICGLLNAALATVIPSVNGYVVDRFLTKSGAHRANPIYSLFDRYLQHVAPHSTPATQIKVICGTVIVSLMLAASLVFTRSLLANIGGQRVIFKLRNDLYEHIQSLSLSFFQQNRSGSIVSRLTSDIGLAQNFIGNACTLLWMDSLSVVGVVIWLFFLNKPMAIAALFVMPFWVCSVRFFGTRIRKASHAVQEGLSELSGQVQEKVSGVTVVQAFSREKRETRMFHMLHRSLLDRQITTVRLQAFNMCFSDFLMRVAPASLILFGSLMVLRGQATLGMMVTFWATIGMFYMPLQRLTDLAAVIANASAAIERIFDIFDIEPEIKDREGAMALPERIHGRVEFKKVSFGYDPEVRILKCLNLTIEPGQVVAFVGPSGAGKSTLVSLVPRFYDVTKGEILVDGINIADVKVKSLRKNIGMVLQDNILFTGTIRDNILYGRADATDDEVIDAAIAANAHDFILSLPDGYDTEIGERGTKLSGGQKQRIAISRAFLRDPRILILDEATSALDSESEKLIQAALDKLMVGRTTLIIAHRLSTIMHADKIVCMQDGRIVEIGTHNELLSNRDVYYHLYKAQFEHALSLPMPEEFGVVEEEPDTVETPASGCDNNVTGGLCAA